MSLYTITIGGSSGYSIAATARFNVRCTAEPNDANEIDSVLYELDVVGELVGSTPATVAALFESMTDEVSAEFSARSIVIDLDGSTIYSWLPSDGFVGPFVTLVESVDSDGNWDSHVRYHLVATFRTRGTAGDGQAYEFDTGIIITKENGKTIEKIWQATAKAASVSAALSKILTFKPAVEFVTEQIGTFPEQARATGRWVWDARKTNSVLSVEETIEWIPCESDYEEDLQAGTTPILHETMIHPGQVVIRGVVKGFDPATLAAPAEHFGQSDTMVRARHRETQGKVRIFSALEGIYSIDYMEHWIFTTQMTPAPNHADNHNVITFTDPPPNGAIGP